MKAKLTEQDVTQDVKSSVSAYLLARAYAETMRAAVDKIEREILTECPLTNGLEIEHGQPKEDITEPKYVYLCTDEDMLKDYYSETNKRLRAANLKPDTMQDDYCPALVAEELQRETERLVIGAGTEMMGLEFDGKEMCHRLLCKGLDTYQKFIDLLVGLVVSLPDFKSPLH